MSQAANSIANNQNCKFMKRLLISFFALTLSLDVFAQFNLGKVSFVTDSVWIISGNGITQIWSDAVQTDNCRKKESFKGSEISTDGGYVQASNFTIDCRSNPGQKGDLFSWRAVSELKDKLCPAPWRVPTKQNFIDLDIAMEGTGLNRRNERYDQFITNTYLNPSVWGGTYGGFCRPNGSIPNWDFNPLRAFYWSQEDDADVGFRLGLGINGYINVQGWSDKGSGYTLRCVQIIE